jgi:PAS domain S-box-containing protein
MTALSIEERYVAVAAAALERVAAAVDPERALVLAICDADGRPSDLLVRDQEGRLALLAGVPEEARPQLGGIVALASAGEGETSTSGSGVIEADWPPDEEHVAIGSLQRAIVERAPIPLLLADGNGTILHASAFSHDLGYRAGEVVGDSMLDYVHPIDRDRFADVHARLVRGERPSAAIELRWRRRDGGYSNVDARMRATGSIEPELAGGVVVGLRSLQRPWSGLGDVVAAANRHRILADASGSGVAIISGAEATLGSVLDANAPFGRIMGATTGQLVGTRLASLVVEGDANRIQEALTSIAKVGGQRMLEVKLSGAQVVDRLAEITIKPESEDGERSELIVRVRDVTDELRLVGELTRTVDRLERSNHELAEFARITAHDLGAPLLAVSRLIDLISGGGADPEFPATLDAIRSAIGRMQAMVDGVMGYTESLESTPDRAPFNLGEALQRVLDALAVEITESGASVTHGELPTVHGDQHQLGRVLQNLISNALKFGGDEPPKVRVDAHRGRGVWRISVSDEGPGIPEDKRGRIFELFARSEGSVAGRGIGLATCRRIIEVHGGRIWVESNEPHGSVFNFTLPNEPTVASA